uniref:DUF6598 domain-containing protein n=1 Tax=Oryza punctata TaxID=4537 RepID=A0A0E0MJ69_ORYPU
MDRSTAAMIFGTDFTRSPIPEREIWTARSYEGNDAVKPKQLPATHVGLQGAIFSLKLSNITAAVDGPVHLYGYFAVRDHLDPLRNYIFNRTRDDPFIMRQDNGVDSDNSLIPMSGAKRGIGNQGSVLIEFDMKIKNGEAQDDDFQLIDGVIICSEIVLPDRVFTQRIEGDCGAVDMSRALFHGEVEATIQVSISQVHGNGFSLSQLFDGVISKPCDLNRFVVAVVVNTPLFLIFKAVHRDGSDYDVPDSPLVVKVDQGDGSYRVSEYCSLKARRHGYDMKELKLGCAHILLKNNSRRMPRSHL